MALPELFYIIFTWLFGILLFLSYLFFIIYRYFIIPKNFMPKNADIQVFITKENRFELNFTEISSKNKTQKQFEYDGDKYFVFPKCMLLNNKGKSFSIYSKGKPQPREINYNESKWLDNQSINSILNNELIPKLLQPNIGWRDILLIIVTITSIGAFLIVIFIALKIFGVIHGQTEIVQIQANQLQVQR